MPKTHDACIIRQSLAARPKTHNKRYSDQYYPFVFIETEDKGNLRSFDHASL